MVIRMPNKVIESYAEQSGKTIKEVEKIWEETKEQAKKKFPKGEEDPEFWPYVNIVVRLKLGIEHKDKKKASKKK